MELNFLWMICTILSISFGVMGLHGKFWFSHNFLKNSLKIFISPSSGLLPQEVHDVGGELAAGLVVLVQLLVVDAAYLGQLGAVVRVLDRGLAARAACGGGAGVGRGAGTATFLRT